MFVENVSRAASLFCHCFIHVSPRGVFISSSKPQFLGNAGNVAHITRLFFLMNGVANRDLWFFLSVCVVVISLCETLINLRLVQGVTPPSTQTSWDWLDHCNPECRISGERNLISMSLCDIKLCSSMYLCWTREDMMWTVAAQKVEWLTIRFEKVNEKKIIKKSQWMGRDGSGMKSGLSRIIESEKATSWNGLRCCKTLEGWQTAV